MNKFNKILIANRGEIAVRVIRTAKKLGFRTVAVFSDADSNALHVTEADQAVNIGLPTVTESYLNADTIIAAARKTGADAIHPGYGFLSENADFARRCEAENIVFIGPTPDAIELMGSKRLSKVAMLKAGVPCIPGYQDVDQSEDRLITEANKIGFPIMLKASAGGGGRGMRLVAEETELPENIKTARSEALSAFGSDELIIEKAVIAPRHIEIQVFADSRGNVVYLGERDCSVQRRHQKVVEEAPSPFVNEQLRQRMGEAAVNVAKSCDYLGAGTVEFLVDSEGDFYFLEMNTRLQVEHPVTEMITGQDLVAWQIKVASGEALPVQQQDIQINGHSIEVRLYAEDATNNFMPQTGEVLKWSAADNEGIRIDSGIKNGSQVSPYYDPMLAKVVSWGENRNEAIRKLACAVEDTVLLGVNTNKQFLANILRHEVFVKGDATTAFLEKDFIDDNSVVLFQPEAIHLGLAAILLQAENANRIDVNETGWRITTPAPQQLKLEHKDQEYWVSVLNEGHCYQVTAGDEQALIELNEFGSEQATVTINGIRESIDYVVNGKDIYLNSERGNLQFTDVSLRNKSVQAVAGNGKISALMDGVVVDVLVPQGAAVKKGDTLVVLEAMKMEHPLKADMGGVVESVNVSVGEQVKLRQLLINVAAEK